jgi:hypothetical protein
MPRAARDCEERWDGGSADLVLVDGGLGARAESREETSISEIAEIAHEARADPEDDAADVALGVELREGMRRVGGRGRIWWCG